MENRQLNLAFYKGALITVGTVLNCIPALPVFAQENCINYWINPNTNQKECLNSRGFIINNSSQNDNLSRQSIIGENGTTINLQKDVYTLGTHKTAKFKPVSYTLNLCNESNSCSNYKSPKDIAIKLQVKHIGENITQEESIEFYLISKEFNQIIVKGRVYNDSNKNFMPGDTGLFSETLERQDLPSKFDLDDYELIFIDDRYLVSRYENEQLIKKRREQSREENQKFRMRIEELLKKRR